MNKLKIKTQQVIDLCEWNDFVEQTYGRPYNFQQQDGCKSRGIFCLTIPDDTYDYEDDTVPEEVNHEERGVSFKAWLERDPKQKLDSKDEWEREHGLDLWWARNFYPDVQMVANDLYDKGLIEAGDYVININW